jgi:hypothetical protein
MKQYAPFCKSSQKLKYGYIMAGAGFVKWPVFGRSQSRNLVQP